MKPYGWHCELVHTESGEVIRETFLRDAPLTGPDKVKGFEWRATALALATPPAAIPAAPSEAVAASEQEGELLPTKERIDAVVTLLDYLLASEREHWQREWPADTLDRTVNALAIAQTRKDLVAKIAALAQPAPVRPPKEQA